MARPTPSPDPQALGYLCLPAEQALQRNAYQEGIDHLTNALDTVERPADAAERGYAELCTCSTLGLALLPITRGHTGRWRQRTPGRAIPCRQLGDPSDVFGVLDSAGAPRDHRGAFRDSRALLEERLRSLSQPRETGPLVKWHELLACSLFHEGTSTASLHRTRQQRNLAARSNRNTSRKARRVPAAPSDKDRPDR